MNGLPSELHKKIFQHLKKKDLQTCYFVCKSWYSTAILLNWHKVTLLKSKIDLLKSHLSDSNYHQYFKHGYLIKTLMMYVEMEPKYKFSKQELLLLLRQLQNLSEIYLLYNPKEYLEFLLDADLRYIKKIDFNPLPGSDLPFLVFYKFRDSISSMNLIYDKITIDFNSQQISLLNTLTQFKKLVQLEFYNRCDIDLTPSHIQDNCHNLKHLMFFSDYSISDNTMLHLLDKSSKINLNFIASLNHLELEFPALLAAYTRYLVDYLPGQLSIIHIKIVPQKFFNWIEIVGMELALKLMERMGKIKETCITFERNTHHRVQDGDETNITKYFTLLNAFRGNRQTYCEACFSDYDIEEDTDYYFKYNSNGNLVIGYGIHGNDFNSSSIGLNLPDKNISTIGPEIFNTLRHYLWDEYDDVLYRVLKYSLLNCCNLQSFTLSVCEGFFIGRMVTHIIEYKHKENLTSPNSSNCNINFLKMSFISPAQTYFNLVTTHLHDIEFLKLETRDWGRLQNESIMDLTCFKKLKSFAYITRVSTSKSNDGKNNGFVLLKFTNGKERHYYLDKERNKNLQLEFFENSTIPLLTLFCDDSVTFDIRQK